MNDKRGKREKSPKGESAKRKERMRRRGCRVSSRGRKAEKQTRREMEQEERRALVFTLLS